MNTGEFYTNKETGETGRCVKTYCGSQVMDFPSRESYVSYLGSEHKLRKATRAEIIQWIKENWPE